jgi:NAD(P)-dependent dehydrogenase (short-subunit alcohol dehydrogenase family)
VTDSRSAARDATGKVFVVTGGNSGLGFETARNLASMSPNNTVILGCRDLGRGEDARRAIEKATGNSRVRAMTLDVSALDSVRDFAARPAGPIDALVFNAGISRGPRATVDGLDGVFETNHLGHFLLTVSLLEKLSSDGRVICVSSDMHQPPGPKLRWPGAAVLAHPDRRLSVRLLRYSYSKLCNLYFVYELSRRLRAEGSGLSVAAFNPGLMTETAFATTSPPVGAVMRRLFASRLGNLAASGMALADLAAGRGAFPIDGLYFDRTAASASASSALSYDESNARDLWLLSEKLTGVAL